MRRASALSVLVRESCVPAKALIWAGLTTLNGVAVFVEEASQGIAVGVGGFEAGMNFCVSKPFLEPLEAGGGVGKGFVMGFALSIALSIAP